MLPKGFGQNVRALRLIRGMSQRALAAQVGCSPPMLVAIELGRQMPSAGKVPLFARALDTSIDALFDEGAR
jgi:transcriptional regulator with XRE-family HTH domain